MRTVIITRKSGAAHIEAPGCVISINPALVDGDGRSVCSISIAADGNRYPGEPEWWVDGVRGDDGRGIRVVRTPATYAPIPAPVDPLTPPECEQIAAVFDELLERYWLGAAPEAGVWNEVARLRSVLRGVPASEIEKAGA